MTITEIARHAGVCCATVSRVINHSGPVKQETRERVEAVMQQYHYSSHSIAKTAKRSEQDTIAVVVPDISNPFFSDIIKGISRETDIHSFNIVSYDTDEDVEKEILILKRIKAQSIKGLIIAPITDDNAFNSEYLKLLESMGIPICLVDRDVKYSNFDGVFIDNIKGAFDATSALIREGHLSIAIISGPKTSKPGRDRLRGFQKAFLMNKLEPDENLLFYGDYHIESGYALANEILSLQPRPTAIFAANNQMGLGAIKSITEHNLKIPADIALIIFDEVEIFNFLGLGISSVAQPTIEMGRIAVLRLMEKISSRHLDSCLEIDRKTLVPTLRLKGSEKLVRHDSEKPEH